METVVLSEFNQVIKNTETIFAREEITATDLQWEIMKAHFTAFAERLNTGEKLPEMEEEMFNEISQESKQIAGEILAPFENSPKEEAWLLSMHVENARNN